MARDWYYQHEGRRSGPVPARRLQEMAFSGQLRPTDLLWAAGLDKWSPAGESKTLFPSSPARRTSGGAARATLEEEPIVAEAVEEHSAGIQAGADATVDQSPFRSGTTSQPNQGFPTIKPIDRRHSQPSAPKQSGGFFGGFVYAIGFAVGLYTMMEISGVFDAKSKRQNAPAKAAPAAPNSWAGEAAGQTRIRGKTRGGSQQAKALAEVRALIEKGGDVNAHDAKGFTPIHWAARNGYEDVAKFLVEHGADLNTKETAVGQATPLHVACTYNHLAVAKLLVTRGATVDSRDKWGGTPLQYAAFNGHDSLLELLIASGADINAKDQRYGITALQVAVAGRNTSTVKLLIAKGADIHSKNKTGETPLATALRMNNTPIAELLRELGARR